MSYSRGPPHHPPCHPPRRICRVIPAGCAYGNYYGYSLYHCGGTYYQKSGSGYVIVYF